MNFSESKAHHSSSEFDILCLLRWKGPILLDPLLLYMLGDHSGMRLPEIANPTLLSLTNQLSLADSISPYPSFVPSLPPAFSFFHYKRQIPPLYAVWYSPTTIRELLCAAQSETLRINHRSVDACLEIDCPSRIWFRYIK